MNGLRARLALPLLLSVSLLAFGCASPPEAEQKAAAAAVSAAKAAGADRYAASDFAAVTAALRTADSEMGAKKYKEAKESYEKAKGLAERAAKAAEGGKAAMKADVEKQVGDVEKRWQALSGKAKVTAKKLKKEQQQAWEADAKAVTEGLQAVKSAVAVEPATAKERLGTVVAMLDKWDAQLAAAATPAKPVAKAPAPKKK